MEILISNIPIKELAEQISNIIDERLNKHKSTKPEEQEQYLTREEVAKALHISKPTLNKYTKEGILKSYRIGERILYKSSEVYTCLKEIEFNKFKRQK